MMVLQTVSQIFNTLMLPLTILFSLLPAKYQTSLRFTRDKVTSQFRLAFGRLYPRLEVPYVDLSDKTAIITGGNSGIGLQIGIDLARMGADVTLACRNSDKAQAAVDTVIDKVPNSRGRVRAAKLDTSSLDSVRDFAATWTRQDDHGIKHIDILVHNAGIATEPKNQAFTDDGMEMMYATNLLGSFLMTHLLEPHLSPTARVVFTSSTGQYALGGPHFTHNFGPASVRGVIEPGFHCAKGTTPADGKHVQSNSASRYQSTKSMQCALAKQLQKKWDQDRRRKMEMQEKVNGNLSNDSRKVRGRTAHSFTPNFAATPIFQKLEIKSVREDPVWCLLRATTALAVGIDQGAATGSWLASTDDEDIVGLGRGGGYYDRMTRRLCEADLYSDRLLARLWSRWEADAGVVWR